MKKKFWKKFLKIKISILATLFIFALIAIQLPWLKKQVAQKIIQELAQLTESQVSFSKYEGFIPLSFDFYSVEFKHENKTWLSIDRIQLNRSLLHFLILKHKNLNITLDQVHLYFLPTFNPEKTTPSFSWPNLPFKTMNVDLHAKDINIAEEAFGQNLPQKLHLKTDLFFRRNGQVFNITSSLTSKQYPEIQLKFSARGFQRHDLVQLQLELLNPHQNIVTHFIKQSLPPMDIKLSITGSPNAMIAFSTPQMATEARFRGHLKGHIYAHHDALFWREFMNNKDIECQTQISFDQKGLRLDSINVTGEKIKFQGAGFLDRHYSFCNTHLEGHLFDLDFMNPWVKDPIEGELDVKAILSQNYQNPCLRLQLNSDHLAYKHFIAYQMQSEFLIEPFQTQYVGEYQIAASLNQSPLNLQGHFTYCNPSHFDFHHAALTYGNNHLQLHSFKKINQFYQSSLDYDFQKIALFSPLIRKEMHGDVKGYAVFDLDVKNTGLLQTLQFEANGSHLQHPLFNVNDYSFWTSGVLDWNNLKNYQGETLLTSNVTNLKTFSWDSVRCFIQSKLNDYQYKIQSSGEFSLISSGQIELLEKSSSIEVRQLSGSVNESHFNLINPFTFDYLKPQFSFTPILLKVGNGQIYLNQDYSKDILAVDFRQLPVESVTYFIPGFDVRGTLQLNGELQGIFSNVSGSLAGKFTNLRVEDYQEKNPYHGSFDLTLNKDVLKGDVYCARNEKDYAQLSAEIPLNLVFFPFKSKIDYDHQAALSLEYLGPVNPFIKLVTPQNHLLDGNLNAQLKLRGSFKEPKIKGFVSLRKGYYENLFIGLVLKDVSLEMLAKGKNLHLTKLTAHDDAGANIEAEGKLALSFLRSFPYSIHFNIENGQVVQFDFLNATLLGKGVFEGDFKKAYLNGKFELTQADINLPGSTATSLPKLKVQYVYARKQNLCDSMQRTTKAIPIYFDIDLETRGQTIIRGRGLDSSWSGKLLIRGSDSNPLFKGKLTSNEGTFDFAGRLFELTEGTIHVDGDIEKDTSLNLTAAQLIERHQILINLKGPLQAPYLRLRSEPSLSQREVLSLVLFGQTAQRLTPFQAVALTHTLATLGGIYRGPGVVDRLRKGIGLDQLSLGSMMYDNSDYTTVQVGKYITRSILITLNRPITADSSPFVITAQIRGGFQLQTYFDQSQISKILLQWRFSY